MINFFIATEIYNTMQYNTSVGEMLKLKVFVVQLGVCAKNKGPNSRISQLNQPSQMCRIVEPIRCVESFSQSDEASLLQMSDYRLAGRLCIVKPSCLKVLEEEN